MRDRIVAAWRVLRGEWTAKPPEPTLSRSLFYQPTTTSSTASEIHWRQTG